MSILEILNTSAGVVVAGSLFYVAIVVGRASFAARSIWNVTKEYLAKPPGRD